MGLTAPLPALQLRPVLPIRTDPVVHSAWQEHFYPGPVSSFGGKQHCASLAHMLVEHHLLSRRIRTRYFRGPNASAVPRNGSLTPCWKLSLDTCALLADPGVHTPH